ncbi:DNA damage-inducible transcript 3 protein [Cyrtonyx montezumae]|uniref:DNA damage-inducible transcript 3 protein n=1 Tax=Cyrtonyx montezumae TaxID=9017 RepID=UPI0032DBAFFD
MAAAGGAPPGAPPAWFLELQELLAAAEPLEPPGPGGARQVSSAGPSGDGRTELRHRSRPASPQEEEAVGAALSAEPPPLPDPHSAAPEPPPRGGTPPGQEEEEEEEEEGRPVGRGAKRKRAGGERRRTGEQRVRQLSAHNERLRLEVGRLSEEVRRARAALIERVLSLQRT